MVRAFTVLSSLIFSGSAAWGQVIFAPAEPCYQPWKERVVTNSRELIGASGPLERIVLGEYQAPNGHPGPVIVPSGPCVSAEALGIDPLTGQPLYFRKRDLLPPEALPRELRLEGRDAKADAPATQPQQEIRRVCPIFRAGVNSLRRRDIGATRTSRPSAPRFPGPSSPRRCPGPNAGHAA